LFACLAIALGGPPLSSQLAVFEAGWQRKRSNEKLTKPKKKKKLSNLQYMMFVTFKSRNLLSYFLFIFKRF
jgi:hypothetical protein